MLRTNLFSIDLKFGGNANFQLLVRAFYLLCHVLCGKELDDFYYGDKMKKRGWDITSFN